MTTVLSVRIDADTKARLDALAKRARRSKSFIAAEAIAAFVEAETRAPWRTCAPSGNTSPTTTLTLPPMPRARC